ncbi:MAG: CotH kinase family protein [Bacteroidia bacterium]
MSKKVKIIIVVVALSVLGAISYFFQDGLILKSVRNYAKSISSSPQEIEILVKKKDFKKIEEIREKSIEKGHIINEDSSYVDGKLVYNGDTLKIELRLKGHMLDHVKGEKWSYRIKVKKGKTFLGMKRFTLQHPGTRNYAYEWLYHKLMAHQGIISLNYDFIKVNFNGDNLGIYAVEEHFAQELAERNNRPNGPFMRFNPENYWEGRYTRDILKMRFHEEYSSYISSFPEFYDRKNTRNDSTLLNAYLKAQNLLEQFKRNELKTSEVFDVELMAKFHAVIDLIGGHHSLDWSDVKYYFNPETNKIEPVAYESVSAFETKKLCGSFQFFTLEKEALPVFHQQLFSDTTFFKAYIQEVERISDESYLKVFLKIYEEQLNEKLSVLYSEFPYKDFTTDIYFKNQKIIKKMLAEPKPFNAFLQRYDTTNNTITVALGSVSAFPYKVVSISCGSEIVSIPSLIIECKQVQAHVNYNEYAFTATKAFLDKIKSEKLLKMQVQILGSSETKSVEIADYPYAYKPKEKEIENE